jgi:hypothetical protein
MKASERDIRLNRTVICLVVVAVLLLLPFGNVPAALSAPLFSTVTIPNKVGFEGYLTDGTGQPISDGAHSLAFRVYSGVSDPLDSRLWVETQTVTVTTGLYSALLGSANPLTNNLFNGDRWIGVRVDAGTEITPRTPVASVPFALNAEHANSAEWGTLNGKPSNLVTGAGVSPRVAYWDSSSTITSSANFTFNGNQVALLTTGSTGGLLLGGDAQLYRSAATLLRTPGSVTIDVGLNVGSSSSGTIAGQIKASSAISTTTDGISGGLFVGSDTQLYRSTTNTLRTPDSLTVDTGLNVGSASGAAAGDVAYSGALKTYKNATLYTGYAITLLGANVLTNTNTDGNDTIAANTYTVDVDSTTALAGTTYGFSGPSNVRVALVRVQASWTTAAQSSVLRLMDATNVAAYGTIRAHDTMLQDGEFLVPVDASGQFKFVVVGTANIVTIQILGYGL